MTLSRVFCRLNREEFLDEFVHPGDRQLGDASVTQRAGHRLR
jgi:hypothetical protein